MSDTNEMEVVGGDLEQNITSSHQNTNTSGDGAETEDKISSLIQTLVYIIILPFLLPLCSLAGMIFQVCGWKYKGGERREEECKNAGSLYKKVHLYRSSRDKMRTTSIMVTCRLGCVLLLWLLLSTLALRPALKTATLLGVIHWKWSLLAAFLILSYPFIFINLFIFSQFYAEGHFIRVKPESQVHYYRHYVVDGLFDSLVSLLYIAAIFLFWMLYFHAQTGLNAGFDKYATWTLVALLVAAILWLLKAALLLRWEQKAIYEKFRPKILMSGFSLWALLFFLDGEARLTLLPCRYLDPQVLTKVQEYVKSSFFSKRNARGYIVSSMHVSLEKMRDAAEILTILTKISTPRSTDDAHQLSVIQDAYQQKINTSFSKEATTKTLIDSLPEETSVLLTDVLLQEYPTKDINQVPLDKWMVEEHKSCLSVAYTLTDAFATVRVLDTILTSCLVIVVIVVWLLATELASTTVLVVIASPFLAFTFVFGDICKTFFQGFIFAFINHPFDVGDRCIINGDEVEVKRVNIMKTTCVKIGTNEKMIYPNSKLAAGLIINLGDKLDPNDVLELVLHPSTKVNDILEMKKHIENFIDSGEQRHMFEKAHEVVVKEINNGIKIIVSFQHTLDRKDISYSQFLVKRDAGRSTLFVEIKKFREHLGLEVATL